MDKLVYFQVNHKFHRTGGTLKWKVGKDKYENKTFEPHELVHPCWSMSPRPPNPCLSQSVTPSRFRDGCTVGYLPMSMHACYTSTRLTRMSHPENGMGSSPTGKPNILLYLAGEPENIEYLKGLLKKPQLTARFGNPTAMNKFRACVAVPQFGLCYLAKMWQDNSPSWLRSTLRAPRELPDTAGLCQTQSASASTKVEISGVERVVFLFKDWATLKALGLHTPVVVIFCDKTSFTAHLPGVADMLRADTHLSVLFIGRLWDVAEYRAHLFDKTPSREFQGFNCICGVASTCQPWSKGKMLWGKLGLRS